MVGIEKDGEAFVKEINGCPYKCSLFASANGLKLLAELKGFFGPALGSTLGRNLDDAIARIGGGLTPDGIVQLMLRVLDQTTIEEGGKIKSLGNRDVFNLHFRGKYGEMFKVAAFVLEVNYADFFGEIKNLGSAMIKKAETIFGFSLSSLITSKLSGLSTELQSSADSTPSALDESGT